MVSVVLPFLMSVMLGRTIDLKTYDIGGDIYDHNDYTEVPLHVLNSTYNILDPNTYPYSYVGLPADLVLRIKSNHLSSASGILGLDGLLRTSWKSRATTIAVSSLYQTVYREIKDDAKQIPNWTEQILRSRTHYAASAIYGGWSAIFYKFLCTHPDDDVTVRNILTSKLGEVGTISEKTIGLWNEAFEAVKNHPDLKDKVTVQVKSFSSHPIAEDISKPSKVLGAIKEFEDDVGAVGHPIFVEYRSLHKLDSRFPSVRPNHDLDREMEIVDEMYDDLRYTRTAMRNWLSNSLTEFTDEQEDAILKLYDHLRNVFDVFHSVAGNASIYNPMDANLLKSAMLMYHRGLTKQTSSYKMLFRRLKEDFDAECEDTFGRGVKGLLKVAHNEKIELGQLVDGLEECKKECIEEPKCRSIGFAEQVPVLEYDHALKGLKIIRKERQCWLFFRSSRTTTFYPAKPESVTKIYDRNCY